MDASDVVLLKLSVCTLGDGKRVIVNHSFLDPEAPCDDDDSFSHSCMRRSRSAPDLTMPEGIRAVAEVVHPSASLKWRQEAAAKCRDVFKDVQSVGEKEGSDARSDVSTVSPDFSRFRQFSDLTESVFSEPESQDDSEKEQKTGRPEEAADQKTYAQDRVLSIKPYIEKESDAENTTVMMHYIPANCSRDQALKIIDHEGFAGCYDFFYLPYHFGTNTIFGYAFINLPRFEDVQRFRACFSGYSRWPDSDNVCEVTWSVSQGYEQQVERYRNSPIMHERVDDGYKPAIFRNGVPMQFPTPTKTVRRPRPRPSTVARMRV